MIYRAFNDIQIFKRVLAALLYSTLILALDSCSDNEVEEVFVEGEAIPGIEIFFPLGHFDAEPMMPKISPDGTKILFSGPSGLPEWKGLWVMDLNSQEKILLHPDGKLADWAPDSEWVVFNIDQQIYKMKITGSSLTQLTFDESNFFANWNISGQIYFDSNIESPTGLNFIWRMEASGQTKIRISYTPEIGENRMPDCFDANKIVHIRYTETGWPELFTMNSEGEDVIRLTDNNQFNLCPKYSNSGKRISFFNARGIYIINADGSNVKRIIPNQLYSGDRKQSPKLYTAYPSWHPDGQRIVYEHFEITRSQWIDDELLTEGYIKFYIVNANTAINSSNLN